MAGPFSRQSPLGRGLRVFQLGVAFGFLALLAQALLVAPLLPFEAGGSDGVLRIVSGVLLRNFGLLIAAPLLVSAAALAVDVRPVKLVVGCQSFILVARVSISGVVEGIEVVADLWVEWVFALIAAAAGGVFGVIGFDKVGAWVKRRAAAPTPVSPPTPPLLAEAPAPPSAAPDPTQGSPEKPPAP